ncbi:site-specific integrase [Bacillus sp. PsM16]|uniref:tyrosine-type recombinase/integrase n=1 Tax=Bacillus sp. PsM16 TaxID=3031172 RepID=UPI00263B0072|nr:site-specific integrase [Bacillus sp. PsM16]MDN4636474.1 site-specific integrase [Bacillus sp. PsM16]
MSKCLNCIICGKSLKRYGRLCRTCETNKLMTKKYFFFKDKFKSSTDSNHSFLKEFMLYLDSVYGDQKREIAARIQSIHSCMEDEKKKLILKKTWNINDLVELDIYREDLSVAKKTAIYHLIEFLKKKFNLTDDWNETSILKTAEEIPVNFKNIAKEYLNFLKKRRKLKHWTRYQICFNLKYFFEFIHELDVSSFTQIQRSHVIQYLTYLKKKNSQKTVYTRSRELESLFKWAYDNKKSFSNPMKKLNVNYFSQTTSALTIAEQKELISQWLQPDCDPLEASIGLLAIVYACSPLEISNIKLNDLSDNQIKFSNRPIQIDIPVKITTVLNRYLDWRENFIKGAHSDYLFITRRSYKLNKPVSAAFILSKLERFDITTRILRATRLINIAQTGNVKLLEGLGLSYEGTRPYLKIASHKLTLDN